jgi:uncharacterized membrane protein YfcA
MVEHGVIVLIALVVVAVIFGAGAQRIAGMGFGLVSSPFLVLLLGPFDGILVINACALVMAALVLARVWRHVEWRRYVQLVVPAMIGVLPGSWLAATLPGPILSVSIGVLLILGLCASLVASRFNVTVSGVLPTVVAGFTSGAMNSAAAVGGPAIGIYAVLTRWHQRPFAATLQPYFFTVGFTSLATKLWFSGESVTSLLAWWEWLTILTALLAGLALGDRLTRRISHDAARRTVIVIAFGGAIVTILHGLLA